jgi:hypothetical protein
MVATQPILYENKEKLLNESVGGGEQSTFSLSSQSNSPRILRYDIPSGSFYLIILVQPLMILYH